MIKVVSMDGREIEYQNPPASELEKITRGSIVKVFDPEREVCYWVIIERRFEDHTFVARIDARCILGPNLRHGGRVFFHECNIAEIWPVEVSPIFSAYWFQIFSFFLSFGTPSKALKRVQPNLFLSPP
jgi:hypothetical protein